MRCTVAAVSVALFLVSPFAAAHDHHAPDGAPAPAKLGAVSFGNSCRPQVRRDFNRAVALLHSFWLDEAERTFRKVAAADPDCAMAYWGESISLLHLINGAPSMAEVAAGSAALAKASAAKESSTREAGYVDALRVFYDGYAPGRYLHNASGYAEAMGALAAAYPGDVEAKVFYALALLAADPPDDVALTNPSKAFAVLSPLLAQYPDHPGIAHYIIHACDNPAMARQGLEAARRYASIAPSAPHALHMPSHIFARLGLWQDDIRSNLASKAAAEQERLHVGAENRLHAMEFLEYAYLQTGADDQARGVMEEGRTVRASDVSPAYPDYYSTVEGRFQSLFAIETQDWSRAATLRPSAAGSPYGQGLTLLANAIAAGHLRDAAAAREASRAFDALVSGERAVGLTGGLATLRDEIHAWADFSSGDRDAALGLLRPVADRQNRTGKGEVELPAGEMAADMLLMDRQATPALRQYQASLRNDPNRFNALLGAGQAAEQLGNTALAVRYYRVLVGNCPRASGSALRRLEHARAMANAAHS